MIFSWHGRFCHKYLYRSINLRFFLSWAHQGPKVAWDRSRGVLRMATGAEFLEKKIGIHPKLLMIFDDHQYSHENKIEIDKIIIIRVVYPISWDTLMKSETCRFCGLKVKDYPVVEGLIVMDFVHTWGSEKLFLLPISVSSLLCSPTGSLPSHTNVHFRMGNVNYTWVRHGWWSGVC